MLMIITISVLNIIEKERQQYQIMVEILQQTLINLVQICCLRLILHSQLSDQGGAHVLDFHGVCAQE